MAGFTADERGPIWKPSRWGLSVRTGWLVDRVRDWLSDREIEHAHLDSKSLIVTVIRAWTALIGTISFELSSHYRARMESAGPYLWRVLRIQARSLGRG